MYKKSLCDIAQRNGLMHHLYADDAELYVSLDPGKKAVDSSYLENLEHCIADIQQ